jgi:hypothetical protein
MNNNNYKIIRTIYENLYQRVLECSDNNTNEIFYSNIITSQKIIKLINIEELINISTNISECNRTDDRIYIITKPLENKCISIKEYIRSNSLTLKQQFALTKNIIELSSDIYNMTDIVQQKILDLDKLYIDEDGSIIVNCDLVFEQEYDISDNETLKRMGNIIHFIFSGTEIVDYNISEIIPPDILKIIVRSLTKEYMYPKNALTELIKSPIYRMIIGEGNNAECRMQNAGNADSTKSDVKKEPEINFVSNSNSDDENDTYDIYINDSKNEINEKNEKKEKRKYKKHNENIRSDLARQIIPLIIVVLVLLIGNRLMNFFRDDSKEVSGGEKDVINTDSNNGNDVNNGENESENSGQSDSTTKYFNSELINKINHTGEVAEIDSEIYVEGDKSLIIKNDSEDKIKALFATVDFTDQKFSYLLKQQIGVSAKIKSETDLSVLIVLEAYKDGNVASTFHTKVDVYNDMWSQKQVPINVTNADFLNIYVEYSGVNKVWVDSLYIDVIK